MCGSGRAIASCCAVAPLPFTVSPPPQFPPAPAELEVVFSAVSEFLSLPHPDNTNAPVAIMPSVAPILFSFTLPFRRQIRVMTAGGDITESTRPIIRQRSRAIRVTSLFNAVN